MIFYGVTISCTVSHVYIMVCCQGRMRHCMKEDRVKIIYTFSQKLMYDFRDLWNEWGDSNIQIVIELSNPPQEHLILLFEI